MKNADLLVAALGAVLIAGCASPGGQGEEPREEKVYRTGSNLPVRDPTAASTTKSIDPAAIEMSRRNIPGTAGNGQ